SASSTGLAIGSASPVLDAEVIQAALALFDAVDARGVSVLINSIGCPACRPAYLADLTTFLEANLDRIPEAMQGRIGTNPLRLYDAKDDGVQELLADFRPITSALCGACRDHHAVVRGTLADLGIAFVDDPTLVRGLDYYGRTTFEFTADSGRKQSSLAGGGRYDYLVEQCGGPPTPAIGFSIGIERTLLHLDDGPFDPQLSRQSAVDVYVAAVGEAAQRYALVAGDRLREVCRVEVDTTGRALKAQLKSANLRRARVLLVAGEQEMADDTVQIKNLESGEQITAARGQLLAVVREVLEG
ncbi:MAG TPA: ATP phosphoribosyltransferase regulatory subunit, partial [Candidatus Krumholzibacteria bacterium]|nr:ATP phosphoribosyltransferase regulatory subunit [Candidatus Krumholzibacteria bacterium]